MRDSRSFGPARCEAAYIITTVIIFLCRRRHVQASTPGVLIAWQCVAKLALRSLAKAAPNDSQSRYAIVQLLDRMCR